VNVARGAFLAGSAALATVGASPAPSPNLVGKANGLDRIVSLVRDLAVARNRMERLGFALTPGFRYGDGAATESIGFSDGTSLEFSTAGNNGSLKHDLAQREGPHYAGIEVQNVLQAAFNLKGRGFKHGPIENVAPILPKADKTWRPVAFSFVVDGKNGPLDAAIFTEYDRSNQRQLAKAYPALFKARGTEHPNGATKLSAAWFAVHDLDGASKLLERASFRPKRQMGYVPLGSAFAQEFSCGRGALILFGFNRPGAIVDGLQRWGDHLIGYSVAVTDLERARASLKAGGVEVSPSYGGFSGSSVLIAPEATGGAWLELHAT